MGCWSYVGSDADKCPGVCTMGLNFNLTDENKKIYVLHEFGHALGLDHEHQRSDFWDILGEKDENGDYRFIIGEAKMKDGDGCKKACDQVFMRRYEVSYDKQEQSEYDPNSIMHYWFDINWLKPAYQSFESPEYKKLKPEEKRVINGVHQRHHVHGELPHQPSENDYGVLNKAYMLYKTKHADSTATGGQSAPSNVSTSLPVVIDYSRSNCSNAHITMVKCCVKLIEAMSKEPQVLAQALFGKGFIAQCTLDEMDLNKIKSIKGSLLYSAVLTVVKGYPIRFADFVQILREKMLLYGDVLTEIDRVYHV